MPASGLAFHFYDVIDKYDVISVNNSMTSLVNMTSFQATVMNQRAGNDVAVARLACTRTLSQYDVIDKYDVISGNSSVPAGGQ